LAQSPLRLPFACRYPTLPACPSHCMAAVMATPAQPSGSRVRLNVSVLQGDEVVVKFLLVVAEDAYLDQLVEKAQRSLLRHGVEGRVARVLNSLKAVLPDDEQIGVLLRDAEEIFMVLSGGSSIAGGIAKDSTLLQPPEIDKDETRLPGARATVAAKPTPAPAAATAVAAAPAAADAAMPEHLLEPPAAALGLDADAALGEVPAHPAAGVLAIPGPAEAWDDDDDGDEQPNRSLVAVEVQDYPPPPPPVGPPQNAGVIPGPNEAFQSEPLPREAMHVAHPCEPLPPPASYDNDWLADQLTPRLRDFVYSNFQEDLIAEPKYVPSIKKFVGPKFYEASGAFVSVFIHPQTACGSDPSAIMPVHYHVAKCDLLRFQRGIEEQITQTQQHLDLLGAALRSLRGLLASGMSEGDSVNVMLPQTYHVFDEVEGSMMEVERPLLPNLQGRRPVVVVDTSGGAAQHLPYLRAALQRVLHTQLVEKSAFQFVRFASVTGEPRLWTQEMTAPSVGAVKAADDWIVGLATAAGGRLMAGIRHALEQEGCDVLYVLSSGDVDRAQHDAIVAGIRAFNVGEVPICTVGLQPGPHGELLLRNIAESNHGSFLLKTFGNGQQARGAGTVCGGGTQDAKWTCWRTNLVAERAKQLADSFKRQQMSIGSQVGIAEVMLREETQKEAAWHGEWHCAQRLLLSAAEVSRGHRRSTGMIPDRDEVRELEGRSARTVSARVGGGFCYHTDEVDLGLERLFEHRSAVPWTAHSDTVAGGPKIFSGGPDQARVPKRFPLGAADVASLPRTQERAEHDCLVAATGSAGPMYKDLGTRPRPPLPSAGVAVGQPRGSKALRSNAVQNPWDTLAIGAHERSWRAPSQRSAGRSRGSTAGRGSVRTASADRAAGERAPSPAARHRPAARSKSRSGSKGPASRSSNKIQPVSVAAGSASSLKAPTTKQATEPVAEPAKNVQTLERRWSF